MGLEKLREIPIIKDAHIKHHSYVDLMGLLKALPMWFNTMGYTFFEKGISEKDIGTGDHIESEWTAVKEVTEYVQYSIEILIVAKDIRKVTLETGEELYWSRLLIVMNGKFKKDFQNKYNKDVWYEEMMRQIYERFFAYSELKGFMGKFVVETIDLSNTMKSFLK